MLGIKNAPASRTATASPALQGVKQAISQQFQALTTGQQPRSADLNHAVFVYGGSDAPFNDHPIGSEAWYTHGKSTGFWVDARPYRELIQNIPPNDHHLARRTYDELVRQLQSINDAFAELHANRASKMDMQALARKVLPQSTMDEGRLDNRPSGDEAKAAAFAGLYAHLQYRSGRNFVRDILEHIEDDGRAIGGKQRRIRTWGEAAMRVMRDYMKELELSGPDSSKRRSDLFSENLKHFDDIAKKIEALPTLQAQTEAWAFYEEQLDQALAGAESGHSLEYTNDWVADVERPATRPSDDRPGRPNPWIDELEDIDRAGGRLAR